MTFDTRKAVYYSDPFDMYEAVRVSPRLNGLESSYGKRSGQALGAVPRFRWEPGKDRYSNADLVEMQAIVQGDDGANRQVHIEEFQRRDAGVTVYLFAANHKELNDLVIRFLGALSDVLRATAAYQIGDGEEIEPEDDSVQSWCYRLQFSVRLLCADTLPATYPLNLVASLE